MNWYSKNRLTLKALFVAGFILAPIGAAALIFLAHKTHDKLSSLMEKQWLSQSSATQLIRRDIEDLENQIQRSTGRIPVGDFSFFISSTGLKATHTSLINQSINISTDDKVAFENILASSPESNFVIINKKLSPISYLESSRNFAMLSSSTEAFIKQSGIKPQLLDSFDNPRFQKTMELQTFFLKPQYSYLASHIPGTDIYLLSFVSLEKFWLSANRSIAFVFSAMLGSYLLLFAYLIFRSRKQKASAQWVSALFRGLKAGKIDERILEDTAARSSELTKTISDCLNETTTLHTLFSAKWVDESRRLASWSHFSKTLQAWSEGSATDKESAPKCWLVGSCGFASAQLIESFSRTFASNVKSDDYYFFQSDEKTVNFLFGCSNLKNSIEELSGNLERFAAKLSLSSYELCLSSYFTSANNARSPFELLDLSMTRVRELFITTSVSLDHRNIEIRSGKSDSILFFDGSTNTTSETSRNLNIKQKTPEHQLTRSSIVKKRVPVLREALEKKKSQLKLPPPPNLQNRIRAKSLSSEKSGKAFIKVSDSLGRINWVEVTKDFDA